MKRYLIFLSTFFVFFYPLYAQNPSSTIAFEERVHDFGKIPEINGKVSHTFVFHNNGKLPVKINEIYSGCGCIGKVLSKTPVKPGGKGEVTIIFNPDYKSGFFSKEVVVYSNNGQNFNRIWVEGVVEPCKHPIEDEYPYNFGEGIYLRLKVIAFGYLNPGETKKMDLHYANESNSDLILNFSVEGNPAGLKFINPGKISSGGRGVLSFTFTMPYLSKKDVVIRIYPMVNNKKLKEFLEVKVLNITGDSNQ